MNARSAPAAFAITAALVLAACGGDDDAAADVPAVATDEMSEEMTDDMSEEMTDDMADEVTDDMADEMTDDMSEEMTDDMSDEVTDDMADEMTDDMSDEMTDEMTDAMSGEMTDEMTDAMSGEMTDDMGGMNDVMSQIVNRSELSTLDDALHAADLNGTLHDDGPFTVFAPTNEAFAAYLGEMGMSIDDVVGDTEALTALLLGHVVDGTSDAAAVVGADGTALTSLAGTMLDVSVDGDVVMIGGATVIETDIVGSNGVVHIIDSVLAPPAG